jgi:hypothetical protein
MRVFRTADTRRPSGRLDRLINLPVMVLLLALGPRLLESIASPRTGRIGWPRPTESRAPGWRCPSRPVERRQ